MGLFLPAAVFAFWITDFEDVMLFAMYFIVALVLGQLTARIRAQQAAERERENRATALYLLTRELAESASLDQMFRKVMDRVGRTFDAAVDIFVFNNDAKRLEVA